MPWRARMASATRFTLSGSATSSAWTSARAPVLRSTPASCSSTDSRRPDITTVAPASANALAPASPIPVPAPVTKGQPLANLTVSAPGQEPVVVPLVAGADVPEASWFRRIWSLGMFYVRSFV